MSTSPDPAPACACKMKSKSPFAKSESIVRPITTDAITHTQADQAKRLRIERLTTYTPPTDELVQRGLNAYRRPSAPKPGVDVLNLDF